MYAVIFSSDLAVPSDSDAAAHYAAAAERMEELCRAQPGFVGIDTARGADGHGITVCLWESLEAIGQWRRNAEHAEAQRNGIERWYERYELTVCEVLDRH